MLNIKTISILALAGSAVAAPQGWGSWGANYFSGKGSSSAVATDVEVVTAYTTVTYNGNWNTHTWAATWSTASSSAVVIASSPAPSPVESTPVAYSPVETPTPVASSPVETVVASSPAATPTASSSSGGYMDVVSEWRSKLGLSALTQSDMLQGNALKTVQDSNGQMVHELNPGSFAQVLAPGNTDNFENVFVGGWLCERSDLPGLDGICSTMSQGWSYDGQTGHADILTSASYSKIGCALYAGIWGCDLA